MPILLPEISRLAPLSAHAVAFCFRAVGSARDEFPIRGMRGEIIKTWFAPTRVTIEDLAKAYALEATPANRTDGVFIVAAPTQAAPSAQYSLTPR